MKNLVQRVVTLYSENGKFHSFVVSLEFALVGFVSTYTGGVPTSKSGWLALASGLSGMLWGALKGWLRNNVSQA